MLCVPCQRISISGRGDKQHDFLLINIRSYACYALSPITNAFKKTVSLGPLRPALTSICRGLLLGRSEQASSRKDITRRLSCYRPTSSHARIVDESSKRTNKIQCFPKRRDLSLYPCQSKIATMAYRRQCQCTPLRQKKEDYMLLLFDIVSNEYSLASPSQAASMRTSALHAPVPRSPPSSYHTYSNRDFLTQSYFPRHRFSRFLAREVPGVSLRFHRPVRPKDWPVDSSNCKKEL